MSTVITIPLENNKDIAELVADKQPGDKLYACGTIKALDDQTLSLRIEEVTDKRDDLPDATDSYDDTDEEGSEQDQSIEEEAGNGSSPQESDMAIKMASPGGYEGP